MGGGAIAGMPCADRRGSPGGSGAPIAGMAWLVRLGSPGIGGGAIAGMPWLDRRGSLGGSGGVTAAIAPETRLTLAFCATNPAGAGVGVDCRGPGTLTAGGSGGG